MNRVRLSGIALLAGAVVWCGTAHAQTCVVKKIYSGTTVKLSCAGAQHRARYIGADSPSKGKPFYDLCFTANKALVADREVSLATDAALVASDDKKLYYVYQGSVFINAELIKTGCALAHIIPPNVRYREIFIALQREARAHRLGLWAFEDHNDEPYYVGSQTDRVVHRPSCPHVKSMPFHDRVIFRTRDDALNEGYSQDWRCSPFFLKSAAGR